MTASVHDDPRRYIEDRSMPEPMSGCWIWLMGTGKTGYGSTGAQGGRKGQATSAHRYSYRAFKGPIPDGMVVRHRCDARWCVNPDHLLIGTHKDNSDDKIRRGRGLAGRTISIPNHRRKLTPEQVQEIIASDDRQDVLALRYGVNRGTIQNVRRGRYYREIVDGETFRDRRFNANRSSPIVRPRSPRARRLLVESLLRKAS